MKKLIVLILFIFAFVFETNALERLPISSEDVAKYNAQHQVDWFDRISVAVQVLSDDGLYWYNLGVSFPFSGSPETMFTFVAEKVNERMHQMMTAPGTYRSFVFLVGYEFTIYKFDRGTFEVTQEDIDNGLPEEKFGLDTFEFTDQGWMFLNVPGIERARVYQDFSLIGRDANKLLADSNEYDEENNRGAILAIRGDTLRFRKNLRDNVVNKPDLVKGKVVIDYLDGTQEEFDLLTGQNLSAVAKPTVSISMVSAESAQQPLARPTGVRTPSLVPQVTVYSEPGTSVNIEYKDSLNEGWKVLTTIVGFEGSAIHIKDSSGVPFRVYRAMLMVK